MYPVDKFPKVRASLPSETARAREDFRDKLLERESGQ